MTGKTIQFGLGRVRDLVPSIDGRFKLNASCVRQRSDDGVVWKPTTSIPLRAPRSECLLSECRRPSRADASRSVQSVSEPAISSPTLCGLTGWSDCLYQRAKPWGSGGEVFALRPRSVPRRSLTGSPGTTATTFRERRLRRMIHSSWQVAWYVRSLQFVWWSSVRKDEPFESSVAQLRASQLVGPNGAESGACDQTVTTPALCEVRTRPVTRVSNEKRNADQCPPAGGEPDRHR